MSVGIGIGTVIGRSGLGGAGAPAVPAVGALAPDEIAGLALLWDAADLASLTDGDAVSSWTDSVNSNVLAQAGTARPTYETAIFGTGRPAVRFDGTDDFLSCATVDLSPYTVVTFVLVTASVSATAAQYVLLEYGEHYELSPSGRLGLLRETGLNLTLASRAGTGGVFALQATDTLAAQRILVSTSPRIITGRYDRTRASEQATVWINGVWGGGYVGSSHGRTANNDAGGAFAAGQTFNLGARRASGVPTLFAPMDVGMLLLWGRALTHREHVRLHMWLDDEFDILS